jgi:hypothetical protein
MSSEPAFITISAGDDIERIQKKLVGMPPVLQSVGVQASSNYLLNVLINKEIPLSKSVFEGSRMQAYGVPFFTEKQRRYFFAAIADNLPYVRGGKHTGIETQWMIEGEGPKMELVNKAEGAFQIYSERQARQLGLAGWKKVGQIIKEYTPQMVRSFQTAVNKWIKDFW